MACLCFPEGEAEELLEHVPLATRRRLLLSSTVSFKDQDESSNSSGLLSFLPCTARDQVHQDLPQESQPLGSGAVPRGSQYATSCQDVGLLINGNSQGSQSDQLTLASAMGKTNVGVPLPPNVSDIMKVDCADIMLLSLTKDDTNKTASTGVIASCQDVALPINGNSQGSQADKLTDTEANSDAYASGLEKINVSVPLPQNPVLPNVSAIKKIDCADNMLLSLSKDDANSANTGVIAVNTVDKNLNDFTIGELDHIVLKERRKLLLERKLAELGKPALEATSVGLAKDLIECSATRIKQKRQPTHGGCMTARNQFNDIPMRNASDVSSCSTNCSSSLEYSARRIKEELQYVNGESRLAGNEFNDIPDRTAYLRRTSISGTEAAGSGSRMEEGSIIYSSERSSTEFKSCDGDNSVSANTNDIYSSTMNTSVKVKDEPLDCNNFQNQERSTLGNMVSVKCEEDIYDGIDHMLLRDRMKLLKSIEDSELNSSKNSELLRKTEPAACGFVSIVSESTKPIWVQHGRKRKKTATDSVETALEEDAPGLLKFLLDQGVSVDEIKLYGESESDDALDESVIEGSFPELEAVMKKLLSQRDSALKFGPLLGPLRCTKGSRPSYCLACLFSLVEQSRYLQFRSWPVEWGWCRDLQSFIFVFKRHHRIVLERPEYGYATYFFELLDSLPIDWQVKRLVTAMKLTSCGRITLIENKPLLVGEDLTEGEAKVLMEYGWVPNIGLGTLLNYCDRVVHDRNNESDSSEWRSKIGKLLVDGYNSGTTISSSPAENANEPKDGEDIQIKVEF